MIVVQKVTTLAFSVHDGHVKVARGERLTPTQAREAQMWVTHLWPSVMSIVHRRIPSVLEFFSYTLSYMTVFCGPLCFYADYIAFIDGFDRPTPVVSSGNNNNDDDIELHKARPLPPIPNVRVCAHAYE